MKRRGRLMMVIATVMATVSIVAPLLAGLCFNCSNMGQCESDCTAIKTDSKHAICDTCRHTKENNCPPGYYCCTACVWRHYNCRKGPNYSIQCSEPPYISKLEREDNEMQTTGPLRCSADMTTCLKN
jgi:hypothetical protein